MNILNRHVEAWSARYKIISANTTCSKRNKLGSYLLQSSWSEQDGKYNDYPSGSRDENQPSQVYEATVYVENTHSDNFESKPSIECEENLNDESECEVENHSTSSENEAEPLKDDQQNVADLITQIEEAGGIDDEDLMEILTCPSPVWWEDPPDGYVEDNNSVNKEEKEIDPVKDRIDEHCNKSNTDNCDEKSEDFESFLKNVDDLEKTDIPIDSNKVKLSNCKSTTGNR
ncbi:unnamed protein product [Leptidea sinapis]|uniref:Uncharacterized protein n=1 Tax=Leptidea sinapis TaxID=189913 RepID=A0A5E4QR35_9NEOP|nr:unnamed protein product [Leptidea sinapis]